MAKGSIVRRTRFSCCQCGKSILKLARTVPDPQQVLCYECAQLDYLAQEDIEHTRNGYGASDVADVLGSLLSRDDQWG